MIAPSQHRSMARGLTALPHAVSALTDTIGDRAGSADESVSKAFVNALGFAVPFGEVAEGPAEAREIAAELAGPVMVKALSPGLVHKTERGGVAGPLTEVAAVEVAAANIQGRLGGRLLVEQAMGPQVECFLSLSLHSSFGAVVSFGLGGIWVEVVKAVSHRLAPVSPDEALDMIRSLRGAPVLLGGRGRPSIDVDRLAETIVDLASLATHPSDLWPIVEIEINPLGVSPDGPPVVLDCTVSHESGAGPGAE